MALTWAVIDPKFDDFITKDNFKAIKVDYRLFAESMANVPKFEYNFKYDFKESYYHTIKDVCARVNAIGATTIGRIGVGGKISWQRPPGKSRITAIMDFWRHDPANQGVRLLDFN